MRVKERPLKSNPASVEGDHIEMAFEPPSNGFDLIIMFCGLRVTLDPEGNVIPAGVDFYSCKWGHSATCIPCKEAWLAAGCPQEDQVI